MAEIPKDKSYRKSGRIVIDDENPPLEDYEGDKKEREKRKSQLFGVRPWSYNIRKNKQDPSNDNENLDDYADQNSQFLSVGNVLWVVFFGWWLSLAFFVVGVVMLCTVVAKPYAILLIKFAKYFIWPFGKYVIHKTSSDVNGESKHLVNEVQSISKLGYIVYMILFCPLLLPIMGLSMVLNWFFVVSIPMAKVLVNIILVLIKKPYSLEICDSYHEAQSHPVLICTYRAFNVLYFQYEWKGINIVFLNLMPFVVARVILILVHFADHSFVIFEPITQFFVDLLCSIPITFYIGMSISSIAQQTNYTVGAILNATFGSVTELTLFTLAINDGGLDELILYSLTGSLLCDMLLLPGLSMVVGGIKYKEQKFSSRAAGVSSLLLFVAVVGAFSPTIFYHMFGKYTQICTDCIEVLNGNDTNLVCTDCHFTQNDFSHDLMFTQAVRYLLYFCAVILPLAYVIGLIFTFKTHKHIFEEDEGEEEGAEWSILVSVIVMLVSVMMFGLIAEDVVSILQDVLKTLGVTQAFLGITLIALTPAATEIANAVKFSLLNQISLSVGIGSASAIQVSLIQMPALIWIGTIADGSTDDPFHLIFPMITIFAVLLAVLTFNYIAAEGKTNYFVGASMVIMYLCLIAAFYFIPSATPPPPSPHEMR